MDWNKIKTEYVTTDTSYRKLAKKYDVSVTQISNKSKAEGWVSEREQFLKKTYTKTLDAIISAQAKRVERIQTITDKILNKLEKSVDIMDEEDLSAYRQITSALKDNKELQMLKSEQDIIEQDARIAKLKHDTEKDNDEVQSVIVTIQGNKDEWQQ